MTSLTTSAWEASWWADMKANKVILARGKVCSMALKISLPWPQKFIFLSVFFSGSSEHNRMNKTSSFRLKP